MDRLQPLRVKITIFVFARLCAESEKSSSQKYGSLGSETFVDVETLVFQHKTCGSRSGSVWTSAFAQHDRLSGDVTGCIREKFELQARPQRNIFIVTHMAISDAMHSCVFPQRLRNGMVAPHPQEMAPSDPVRRTRLTKRGFSNSGAKAQTDNALAYFWPTSKQLCRALRHLQRI